jgi:hypothetical protein
MASPTTESTPRERLARHLTLLRRTRMFWRSSAAIAVVGLGLSLGLALASRRAWRSETTVLCRPPIKTDREMESATARAARLGPQLKDLVTARPTLEAMVTELGLYPEKASRPMLEAVEEMQTNVGFRARSGDTFVVSFVADDPEVAERVTARLAETMIRDYTRENLDSATVTRDFLRRELDEANTKVDDASRALAVFLAQNPQFQWGANDSPYAPVPMAAQPGLPGALPFGAGRRLEAARGPFSPCAARARPRSGGAAAEPGRGAEAA